MSFAEEKSKGYVSFIDDWIREMNNVVEYLKQKKAVYEAQAKAETTNLSS